MDCSFDSQFHSELTPQNASFKFTSAYIKSELDLQESTKPHENKISQPDTHLETIWWAQRAETLRPVPEIAWVGQKLIKSSQSQLDSIVAW